MKKKREQRKRLLYITLFAASAIFLVFPLLFGLDLSFFKSLGLIGIMVINFFASATLFFPAPGFLAIGFGGKIYEPLLVALVAAFGSAMGELVGFTFGYSSKKISPSEKHILDVVAKIFHHKHAGILIVLISFIPNPLFDAVGIVAGVSLYPVKKFLFLVFLGRFLRDIIIAYAGRNLL